MYAHKKKQLKKLGTLKQLREEIANITYRYYQHAFSGTDSIKTKQNNSFICVTAPL